MKKYAKIIAVVLLIATCFMTPVMAQRKVMNYLPKYEQEPYHFGFMLGFNEMMYTIKTVDNYQNIEFAPNTWPMGPVSGETTQSISVYNIETEIMPGFTVGIIGSKRLGKYFDLRLIPSLSFADRNITYAIAIKDKNGGMRFDTINNKPIFTTFVEFPLHIKYRSKRFNNVGAYLIGGVNPKLDLASQKSNKQTDSQGHEYINNLVTRRFDCAFEIGAGFDIYNQWFKMGIEIKMSYGMLDIVKRNEAQSLIYDAPIQKLSNKTFLISLLFE